MPAPLLLPRPPHIHPLPLNLLLSLKNPDPARPALWSSLRLKNEPFGSSQLASVADEWSKEKGRMDLKER